VSGIDDGFSFLESLGSQKGDPRFAKKTGINGVFCENGKNDERQRVCLLHLDGGSKFPENLRL
jgi:hypothetical protein